MMATDLKELVKLSHLKRLEAEAIFIMREVVAELKKPVMLYSVGKDSSVLLHLAAKAFYPSKPPFPLLHIDTTWKFREMIEFRDRLIATQGLTLIKHTNQQGVRDNINPFDYSSDVYTSIMKTDALLQALDEGGFDAAIGGARRDEERSRAKERIFSFRPRGRGWDPRSQRPELWNLFNTRINTGDSIRVFPLSNWTEMEIWEYILLENIPVVPLYFATERPVVNRHGKWIMVDDDRMPLRAGELPLIKSVRFRSLGCYPLTAAIESNATNVREIIVEMLSFRTSERVGRLIAQEDLGTLEKMKRQGYF